MQAVSQDPDTARLMGIDVDKVIVIAFAVGAALAGIAGVAQGLQNGNIDFRMGFMAGLKAFTAAVLGGIGNVAGAVVGGLALGVVEALGIYFGAGAVEGRHRVRAADPRAGVPAAGDHGRPGGGPRMSGVPPFWKRLRRTAPDDGATVRTNRPALVACAAGIVLLLVSAFLSWTYNADVLDDLTVYGYPAATQLMLIALALYASLQLFLRLPGVDRWRRVLGRQSGLRRLGAGIVVFVLIVLAIIVVEDPAMIAALDPGAWVALVGAVTVAVSARLLPADQHVVEEHHRFPDAVEILIVVGFVAVLLFGAAYGLGLSDGWLLVVFLAFVGALAAGMSGGGVFDWLSIVFAHHRSVLMLAAFVAALFFPLTQEGSDANMSIATNVLIFAATAMGLNIVVGLAGLLDLGYIAFLGAGAYVGAALSGSVFATIGVRPPFLVVVVIGACVSAVLGLIIGSPTLRVSGDYLAIVTLAFGEIFRLAMFNLDGTNGPNLTRGPNGIGAIPELTIVGFDFGDTHVIAGFEITRFANYYLLLLVLIAFIILVFTRINDSRIGRGWVAIREDEKAAEAMGVNTFGLKLLAFAGGAFLAGLAGTIKAHADTAVSPDQYQFLESAFLLAAVVLGGMGTVGGVMVGAVILKLLPEKLRFFADNRLLLFGLLLVLMMRFRPEGLVANKRRKLEFHEEDTELAEKIEHVRLEKIQ